MSDGSRGLYWAYEKMENRESTATMLYQHTFQIEILVPEQSTLHDTIAPSGIGDGLPF